MTRLNKALLVFCILTAAIAAALIAHSTLYAQDAESKKIPIEMIEGKQPDAPGSEQKTETPPRQLALGANLDFFPTILSAVDSEFGLAIQPWFGVNHFKIRIDIAHMRIPNDIVATKYFSKNNVNTFALVLQYCFGKNFDGFAIGGGIGVWNNMVSNKLFNKKGSSIVPYLTIEGGYIWRFYSNIYMEPCLAVDVMLTTHRINVYGYGFKPLPAAGEITLKFGIYVDI